MADWRKSLSSCPRVNRRGSQPAEPGRRPGHRNALSEVGLSGGEDRFHGDGKTWQKDGGRLRTDAKDSMFSVGLAFQSQNGDLLFLSVHNPIFRDTCLGVLRTLDLQISLPLLLPLADDFHNHVGAFGLTVRILHSMRPEIDNIRLAKLAGPQVHR